MHKCLSTAYCKYFNDVLQLGTNFQSIGNLECLPKMGILAIESPTSHQLSSYFRDENITGKFASKHSHWSMMYCLKFLICIRHFHIICYSLQFDGFSFIFLCAVCKLRLNDLGHNFVNQLHRICTSQKFTYCTDFSNAVCNFLNVFFQKLRDVPLSN